MNSATNGVITISSPKGFLLRSVFGWSIAVLFGATGLFAARLGSLSGLPAAVSTIGVFGLAGGVAHAHILRTAGAKVQRFQYILLAMVWALCCSGGAVPLFFTMGTRAQMALRAFYSFAIFGAMGGGISVWLLRSFLAPQVKKDPMPAVLSWSLGLSLAAVTGDAIGEWLQLRLPPPVAWLTALFVMTVIMGCGSGYSVLLLLKSDQGGWLALRTNQHEDSIFSGNQKIRSVRVLILLCFPFYVNDFANIFIKDWRWWLWIDYNGVKLFPFIIILYLIRSGKMPITHFIGFRHQSLVSFLTVFVIALLSVLFINQNGSLLLNKLLGNSPLGRIPDIPNPLWKWIDLSAGLVLAGICEEVVFRGYLFTFLRRYTRRPLIIIMLSAVGFGLIHWSGGLHQIILTSAAGAIFMLFYLRTYSLSAIILAHFFVNFIDFSGILPVYFFSFLPGPPIR